MKNQILKIGIPNGSLVNPRRSKLPELLERARIYIKNIGTNAPPEVTNIPWLEAVVGRPQELPAMAYEGLIDVFFCGDDWAKEWALRGKNNERVLGLETGIVDLVVAEKEKRQKNLFEVASEYPFIARKYYSTKTKQEIPIIDFGEKSPIKEGIVIYRSVGETESKAFYDWVDAIVESTQSGATIKNFGLKVMEKIMSSEASFYASLKFINDPWKCKKATRIMRMLKGAMNAYGRDLVVFNVPNEKLPMVLDYIRANSLFGDEESVVPGNKVSEITLQLYTKSPSRPLIDIIGDLVDRGATSIEGIPLNYSLM